MIAKFIDHTLLAAGAGAGDLERLCEDARRLRFRAVCVNPARVAQCVGALAGTGVRVAAVADFPLGAGTAAQRVGQVHELVDLGAGEVDIVAPLGAVVDGRFDDVAQDLRGAVSAARGAGLKVILETALLGLDVAAEVATMAVAAGAAFVKTSTGFHAAGGATVEAVQRLVRAVDGRAGVKASGGIRDCESALRLLAAGATVLGTSSGVAIVECLAQSRHSLEELLRSPERHREECRSGLLRPTV